MKPDLSTITDEELGRELARRAELFAKQQRNIPTPLPSNDFLPLKTMIIEGTARSLKDGYENDDFAHYVYEAALEAVYGKEYWNWRNKQKWG